MMGLSWGIEIMTTEKSDKRPLFHGQSLRGFFRENTLLICIMIVALIVRIIVFSNNVVIGMSIPDTTSYVDYFWKQGLRTPGYPLIIDAFQLLVPSHFKGAVALFQMLVSWLSLIVLYRMFCLILEAVQFPNRKLAGLFVLLYGCLPASFTPDAYVITESLSITITMIFLYYAVRFVISVKWKDGVLMVLMSLAGFMIKTSLFVFTFDAAILLVLMLVLERDKRKELMKMAVSVLAVLLFYGLWILGVWKNTGVMSFSQLPPRHNLAKVIQSGAYQYWPDQKLVDQITDIWERNHYDPQWVTTSPVMLLISGKTDHPVSDGEFYLGDTRDINCAVEEFNRYCINADKKNYYSWLVREIILIETPGAYMGERYREYYAYSPDDRSNDLPRIMRAFLFGDRIRCSRCVFAAFLAFFLGVLDGIRRKRFPYLHLGIFGGILTILISVPWGSYEMSPRTLCYLLPFYFASIVLILGTVCGHVPNAEAGRAG